MKVNVGATAVKNEGDIFGMFNSFTGRYQCPRCVKTLKDKTGLSRHFQGHTGIYSYWCEDCKKASPVVQTTMTTWLNMKGKRSPAAIVKRDFKRIAV